MAGLGWVKDVAEAHKKNILSMEDLRTALQMLIQADEKQWAIHQTAEMIKQKYHIKTYDDSNVMLEYQDGFYHNSAEPLVMSELQNTWGCHATKHIASEVIEHIKRSSFVSRDDFNQPGLINLRNGVLNIETLELQEHSPDNLFTYKLSVDYNPKADCPRFKQFLNEVVKPEDTPTIFEMIGYCLYPRNIFEKCFMLHGVGSNGKSTLVNVIKKVLGPENLSSISIQELTENRYAAGWLHGKLANIHSDLSRKAIKDSGIFKMVVSGDPLTVDAKYSPQGITFTPTAKQIYSANQLPMVYDDSDAFYRRWVIIDFPNIFTPDKMRRKLIDELTTPDELSGILNESIKALHNLIAQNDFTTRKTTEEWRNLYTRLSDPIGSFAMDCIITGSVNDNSFRIEKQEVYDAYVLYCKVNKMPMRTPVWFWRGFRERITFSESHTQEVGVWKNYLMGVKLNEEYMKSNIYNEITPVPQNTFRELSEVSPYCSKVFENTIKKSRDFTPSTCLEFIPEQGIPYIELAILFPEFSDEDLKQVLDELKVKGLVFEPEPGFWRKV